MFPAQALAEAMLTRGWHVTLMTDARGARYTGAFPKSVEIETVSSATFARSGLLSKLLVPLRVLAGIAAAKIRFWRRKPAVVIGFGGYPSIPAMGAAWILRLPRLIHEQNGVLGRVNSILAKRVHAVACGTWPTALPEGAHARDVGNPVRAAIRDRAGASYIPPGDYPMQLLVIGGSQGARTLSDIVPPAVAALPNDILRKLRVNHQARQEDLERVETFYADHGVTADVQTFFADVPARMSEAQLVVSRSGASSVADLSVIGRPSVLIPFAAATADHQSANARALSEAGGAVVISEADLEIAPLTSELTSILSDPTRARAMAQAALGTGKPDATERLVALVEEIAGHRT